jgi:hypothetical protein
MLRHRLPKYRLPKHRHYDGGEADRENSPNDEAPCRVNTAWGFEQPLGIRLMLIHADIYICMTNLGI